MPTYKGARLKVKRADEHIAQIEARILPLQKACTRTIEIDSRTGNEFLKYDIQDMDTLADDVAVMIGDAIHNMKCALDYSWFATLKRIAPQRTDRNTKLPCHPTFEGLKVALEKTEIDITSKGLFKFLLNEIKPYDGGDLAIRTIHKLDIRDKHSLLIPVFHYTIGSGIKLEDNTGNRDVIGFASSGNLPLRLPIRPGFHVKDKGDFALSVMFPYREFGGEARVVDTLRVYSQHVLAVVELLEEFMEA